MTDPPLRTHEKYILDVCINHGAMQKTSKWSERLFSHYYSPYWIMFPYWGFPPDYMHGAPLGVINLDGMVQETPVEK